MSNVPVPVNELLQSLINLLGWVLPIVAVFVAGRVALAVAKGWSEFKQSQPENIQKLLELAAEFGADYAEKVGPALRLFGQDKLDAAVDAASRWLASQGYVFDDAPIHEAIEVILFRNPDKYRSSKG